MKHQVLKARFEEVQEIVQLGFWEWDIIRDTVTWSDEIYALFETEKAARALSYENFLEFVHPDDRMLVMDAVKDAICHEDRQYDIRHRIITTNGNLKYLREKGRVKCDEYGSPLFMLGTVQDISDSVRREQALEEVMEEAVTFRELLDKSSDAIYINDPKNGCFIDFNERALEMLGYSRQELMKLCVHDIEESFDGPEEWEEQMRMLEADKVIVAEGVNRRKDGTTFPVEASVSFFSNHYNYVVTVIRDITERKKTEASIRHYQDGLESLVHERTRALAEANRKLACYLHVVDHHVLTSTTDANGVITYASDAFCRATGYGKAELLGKKHNIIRHPDVPDKLFKTMWQTITSGKIWRGELLNRCKNGSDLWLSVTIEPNVDDGGVITGYTAIRHDISDKKKIEELTITDPLTGVYNRRYFYQVMEGELRKARRYETRFCLAMIDLDNFKSFNDTYGHQKGDKALIAVTEKIQQMLRRADDYLFRMGGEEFAVICHCTEDKALLAYAEEMCRAVESIGITHEKNSASDNLSISIGMVIVSPNENTTLDSVYEKADRALYEAKESGRNRVVLTALP